MTRFNAAAERVFGYKAGKVLRRPPGILPPERVREEHRRVAADVLGT